MKITTRYNNGVALAARLRDMGQFYDFVAAGWVGVETADCHVSLVEYPDSSSLSSLYSVVVGVPAGVYSVEIIDGSNEVVAAAEKDVDGIQRAVRMADFTFAMTMLSDGRTPFTGAVTATRKLDGGAFAACANSPTEIGGGVYAITLEASDTNADVVTLKFAAALAVTKVLTIKTSQ